MGDIRTLAEKYLSWIPLTALLIFFIMKSLPVGPRDFANYYFAAELLARGSFDATIFFPAIFNQIIRDQGYLNVYANFAPNTPLLPLAFTPLLTAGLIPAKITLNILSSILLLCALIRLAHRYAAPWWFAALMPLLFFIPIRNEILFGQFYGLIFFLLVHCLLAWDKGGMRWSALSLAFAVALKAFPAFFSLVFVSQREWRLLATLCSYLIFFLLGSLFIITPETWSFYLLEVLPRASQGLLAESYIDGYQSPLMFLKRLLLQHPLANPQGPIHSPWLFSLSLLALKTSVVMSAFTGTFLGRDRLETWSFWCFAFLVFSPYGSTYTLLLLAFPTVDILQRQTSTSGRILFLALLFLICNLPLGVLLQLPFPLSYLRLVCLIALCVLWIRHSPIQVQWAKTLGMSAIATTILAIVLPRQTEPTSTEISQNGSAVLIFDYHLKDSTLTFSSWEEDGPRQTSSHFPAQSVRSLTVAGDDITCGSQVLHSESGNKRLPILIDGYRLLYLSDFGRGLGFFILRLVELPPDSRKRCV